MAVTITEIFDGRGGSLSADRGREYTRVFLAETDDPRNGPETIRASDGIPRLGDPYVSTDGGTDTGAVVRDVNTRQGETPYHWIVEVTYSSESTRTSGEDDPDEAGGGGGGGGNGGGGDGGGGGGGGNNGGGGGGGGGNDPGGGGGGGSGESQIGNPLLRPAEISWDAVKAQVIAMRAADGTTIRNSAGSLFDPPVMTEEVRLALRISRNQATFDANDILTYVGAVNETAWRGFPARCVRCMKLGADRNFESGIYFWKVTMEFEIRRDTWDLVLLDAGYYEKQVDGKLNLITEDFGRVMNTPYLLNGLGRKLPEGNNPVYLAFRLHREVDFTQLGI